MTAIEIDNLTVRYGRTVALDAVTLTVPRGAVTAVVGSNGAGKSSLVHTVLGMRRADAGSVRVFGRDSWRERQEVLRAVGVVPETPDAPPAMSARKLLEFDARLYPRHDAGGALLRLQRFGIPAERPFGTLSRGQRSQVMLTLAIAHQPELLVLDDPSLGLDVVARRALFDELIGELADRGTSVLLTTHDLAAVERIAERVAVLDRGRLLVVEEVETLRARWRRVTLPRGADPTPLAPLRPHSVRELAWGSEALLAGFEPERFREIRDAAGWPEDEPAPLGLEEIVIALVGDREAA